MDDLFRTTADTRFNSFTDPLNPVNTSGGNWGVDPTLMTPSYMAPFRPQYNGSYGGQPIGIRPPGFWSAIKNVALGNSNYGGNVYDQDSASYDSVVSSPLDLVMSTAQKYAVPLAAVYYADKHLSGVSTAIGRGFGGGLGRGVARGFGASAATAATIGRGAATLGGVAGAFALPFAAAEGAAYAFDSLVTDPYLVQRQSSQQIRRNFSGVTFGEQGYGNAVTGGGLSRSFSAKVAGTAAHLGATDQVFDQREVSDIMDYSSRAGLFDTVQASQMEGKLKSIVKQVKLVMSVANTSDMKEAVEILGKMQSYGAVGHSASMSLTRVGSAASIAGISTSQFMNTHGALGAMMFQANGVTPYLGQEAAANSYAGFAAAMRTGALNPALMARMGGVPGAMQSSIAAQLAIYQSPYSQMVGFNSLNGISVKGGVVGNALAFAGAAAKDPSGTSGNVELHRDAITSHLASDYRTTNELLKQHAASIPGMLNADGTLSSGRAMDLLTKRMGLRPEDARAFIVEMISYQVPAVHAHIKAGINKAQKDNTLAYMRSNNMDSGSLSGTVAGVKASGRSTLEYFSSTIGAALNKGVAESGDSMEKWWFNRRYNLEGDKLVDNVDTTGHKVFDLSKRKDGGRIGRYSIDIRQQDTRALKTINDMQFSSDKAVANLAKIVVNGSGIEKENAVSGLVSRGTIDSSTAEVVKMNMNKYKLMNYGEGEDTPELAKVHNATGEALLGGAISKMADYTDSKAIYEEDGKTFTKDYARARRDLEYISGKSFTSNDEVKSFVKEHGHEGVRKGTNAYRDLLEQTGMTAQEFDMSVAKKDYKVFKGSNVHIEALKSAERKGLSDDEYKRTVMRLLNDQYGITPIPMENAHKHVDLHEDKLRLSQDKAFEEQRKKYQYLVDQGIMRPDEMYKELVKDKVNDKFVDAVDKFSITVGNMPGAKQGDDPKKAPSSPTFNQGLMTDVTDFVTSSFRSLMDKPKH